MAKLSREQAIRERRARKQEKRDDRRQAALAHDLPLVEEPVVETPDAGPSPV